MMVTFSFAMMAAVNLLAASPVAADLRVRQLNSGYTTAGAQGSSTGTGATSLSITDISLRTPADAVMCGSTDVGWSWDAVGTPPADPITLSVIDASSIGSRRRAIYGHHESLAFAYKRSVKGTPLPDASSIPFNQVDFQWSPIAVVPGTYRLVLTLVSTGDAVLSDPFTVGRGDRSSCLAGIANNSQDDSSSSSSAATATPTASESTIHTSTDDGSGPLTTASSAASSSATAANGQTSSAAGGQPSSHSATSNSSSHQDGGNHSGAIAAGILVPALVAVAVYIFFLWRKRQRHGQASSASSTERPPWAEKFFGGARGNGAGSKNLATPHHHHRNISSPQVASAAGLAAVAGMVPEELRKEKDELALRAVPPPNVPTSPDVHGEKTMSPDLANGDHWIDFAADDINNLHGPRPLSQGTIARQSMSVALRSPDLASNGLYKQGSNGPLRPSSQQTSLHTDSTISTFGTPAGMEQNLSRASQASVGRDLIAAMPRPPAQAAGGVRSSIAQSDESPFQDPPTMRQSSSLTNLQRSDSGDGHFGVKRKPVPRVAQSTASPTDGENGPFGNEHAVDLNEELSAEDGPASANLDSDKQANEGSTALRSIPITAVADARAETPASIATASTSERMPQGSSEDKNSDAFQLSSKLNRTSGFNIDF
ncbi:unnamed protein product [Jaminaea pallidilutea]